ACAEHVSRALRRPERDDVTRFGYVIFGRNDIARDIRQVGDIEEIEDFHYEVKSLRLGEAETFGYPNVLRDERVTADLKSLWQFRKLSQLGAERINRTTALDSGRQRFSISVVVADDLIELAHRRDLATEVSRPRARQVVAGCKRARAAEIHAVGQQRALRQAAGRRGDERHCPSAKPDLPQFGRAVFEERQLPEAADDQPMWTISATRAN